MHSKPGEIISYFFSIQKIVIEFDPLADLIIKHDEAYDALMTDFFMNSLSLVDEDLTKKFTEILNLEKPEHRKLLVLLVKKFVHSLGFAFLNMRITLFIWDQLFMKIRRNQVEIFICMAISFFCLKPEVLECDNWDHLLNTYYGNSKNIDFNKFYQKYIEIFEKMPFYMSIYEIPLERKQLILSQKKYDGKNQENEKIQENPENQGNQENQENNEKNEIFQAPKEEYKPVIQKSQKSRTIQPKFISKNVKKEEDNINTGLQIDEKEMIKNLLVEESHLSEGMGLLPNVKQIKKGDLLEGFDKKSKKR